MKYVQPHDQPSTPDAPYLDLDAAHGVDGSIPPAKFFNDIQDEILNVITAPGAGLTPDPNDTTQLLQAILALMPTPSGAPSDASLVHWGTDTGAANALIVTPSPAFSSLAPGFTLFTKLAASITGPATITLTPSSGPDITRNVKRRDGSNLQDGDVAADELIGLVCQSDGSFRLLREPPITFPALLASSGYQKLPSGLIIQWSQQTVAPLATTWIFPIAFPNQVFSIVGTLAGQAPFKPNDTLYIEKLNNAACSIDFPATNQADVYLIATGW